MKLFQTCHFQGGGEDVQMILWVNEVGPNLSEIHGYVLCSPPFPHLAHDQRAWRVVRTISIVDKYDGLVVVLYLSLVPNPANKCLMEWRSSRVALPGDIWRNITSPSPAVISLLVSFHLLGGGFLAP